MIEMLESAIRYAKDENGQVPTAHIDYIYDNIVSHIKAKKSEATGRQSVIRRIRKGRTKRACKKYVYARTQDLYKRNPSKLAKYVRENIEWYDTSDMELREKDVTSVFQDLWGRMPDIRQPYTGEPEDPENVIPLCDLIPAISTTEIGTRIARMKRDTAAGPDGILRKHVASREIRELLRLFYCFITACDQQPSSWKKNRTTLLLKQGKDPARVESYRPVTIGSLISRLYWGIVDRKLRAYIKFTPRQKGFVNEAGCFNDVHILNELLKITKKKSGLVAVQLDVSKAFDTVPHEAIGDDLRRKGVPDYVVRMIKRSYEGVTTDIKHGTVAVPLELKRGVKQGDPLLPPALQRNTGASFAPTGKSTGV
jgi:hypothetical protein